MSTPSGGRKPGLRSWLKRHRRGEEAALTAVLLDLAWLALRWACGGAALFGAGFAAAAVLTTTYHPSFTLSTKAVAFIERHEGVRYYAYNDPSGIAACTSGAGHVLDWRMCTYAQLHTRVSSAQITAWLKADTNNARACVTDTVTAHIEQPEYEALVDIVFNAGCGVLGYHYGGHTIAEMVNAGRTAELVSVWEHIATTAGGRYLAGLGQRRYDEATLYARHYYGAGIGYWTAPKPLKPLTKVQKAEARLRAKTGYYSWLGWYLHEGAWRPYAVHASVVRPHVPARISKQWWRRERKFVKARQ